MFAFSRVLLVYRGLRSVSIILHHRPSRLQIEGSSSSENLCLVRKFLPNKKYRHFPIIARSTHAFEILEILTQRLSTSPSPSPLTTPGPSSTFLLLSTFRLIMDNPAIQNLVISLVGMQGEWQFVHPL